MGIVTFGEILLRLAPLGYKKLFQDNFLESSFCGAEANVAVSLANYGVKCKFISKVPDNEIGQAAINSMRYFGVDTSMIKKSGNRIGLYYLEKGAGQRSSKVIYDRKNSSIATSKKEEFNWKKIFENCEWFHFSGINPALSEELYEICLEACKIAREKKIIISCDINYRNKLWSKDEANKKMCELMKYVDVCIGNEKDAEDVFKFKHIETITFDEKINKEGYKKISKEIAEEFGCKYVAFTLRKSFSASRNNWSGMIYSKEKDKHYFSKDYDINIVDRVGSGDSFSAGLIYGLSRKFSEQKSLDFAVAASCLKHSQEGDYNRVTLEEVYSLMDGNISGRIKR